MLHAGFLGTWILIPETCDYQQGEPPREGVYTIEQRGDELAFTIDWTDADGVEHRVEFSGVPDGVPVPFDGGDLSDAMSIEAVSERDLRSSAFWRGSERMVAQRQLDERSVAMRVTQVVRLPTGESLANVAVYRRYQPS